MSDESQPADESPSDPGKRRTLGALGGALGLCVIGGATLPVLVPLVGGAGKSTVTLPEGDIDVCALRELPSGEPKRVVVRGVLRDGWQAGEVELGAAWIVRKSDDVLIAYSAVCPHLGCAIEHRDGDADAPFGCPCHDSTFRADGSQIEGPSPRGLDPLAVRVVEGRVLLRFKRFATGSADRKEV